MSNNVLISKLSLTKALFTSFSGSAIDVGPSGLLVPSRNLACASKALLDETLFTICAELFSAKFFGMPALVPECAVLIPVLIDAARMTLVD